MDHRELLHNLQRIEFAMVEVNLYLNAHPDCAEALAQYANLQNMHKNALAEYEAVCGPIMAQNNNSETWDWVRTPWPWEMGVN